MIKSWDWRLPYAVSTGGRLDDFGAADFDINDKAATEHLTDWLAREVPDVAARAPTRFGGGEYKMALFMRFTGEPFVRLGSRKYHKPDEPPEHYHHVEVFGGKPTKEGKCSRQFALYGPRSYAADGSVESEYVWDESIPTLAEVPLADLPVMTRDQALALLDAFEAWAEANGWIVIQEDDDEGDGESSDVFDIDIETARFDIYHGVQGVTYEELKTELSISSDIRVSPSFMGVTSDRLDRCSLFWSKRYPDCVVVKDWKTSNRHYPIQCKPVDMEDFGARIKQLTDKLGLEVLQPKRWSAGFNNSETVPPRPANEASLAEKTGWLLQTYGYCDLENRVIRLYEPSNNCRLERRAFQESYLAWRQEKVGPREGKLVDLATSGWSINANRIRIKGVLMRPDKPFPTYVEDGELFKNTYLRPVHTGDGETETWSTFMTHLLPKEYEREWFLDWLAHKHRHPGVPSVAVVMVAADDSGGVQGTGRGMLRSILTLLLGAKYVRSIPFDVFTGRSSQGVYTDWGAYSVLVIVDESKDTAESGRWSERRAVYERIKEIVDPRAVDRTFTAKGTPAFTAKAFASYLVCSNNRDALQIPEGDRRVAGLSNGTAMPNEMAEQLQAWMDQPGNIAALARSLEERNLSGFNAYIPPVTVAKAKMQEMAQNDNDEAFELVRRTLGPKALFTGEMVIQAVATEIGESQRSDAFHYWIKRRIRAAAKRLGEWRMPASYGLGARHRIMHWQDYDGPLPDDLDAAQALVTASRKRLERVGRTAEVTNIDDHRK
jgi:hypothetical protein